MGPFIMFWLAVVGTAKRSTRDIRLAIYRGEEPKIVSCRVTREALGKGDEWGYTFDDQWSNIEVGSRIWDRIKRNRSGRIIKADTQEEREQAQFELARHGEAVIQSIEKDYGLSFLRGEEAMRMRRFIFGAREAIHDFQALRARCPDMALIEIARVMEELYLERAQQPLLTGVVEQWERRAEFAQELIRDLVDEQDEFIRSMTEA